MKSDACLSDLVLDRWRVGELSALERARAALHVRTCSACAGRKRELEREALAFDVPLRLPVPVRRWSWRPLLGLAAAAAACLLLLVPSMEAPGVRTKGGPWFSVIARRADGSIDRVLPGDSLAPGDAIRFEVRAGEPAVVAVLGIDAAGAVTPYVEGIALEPGEPAVLPGAIRLDETLGPERLVALFCPTPIDRDRLVELGVDALRRASGDPARELRLDAPDCTQASVLIWKERQ